jgi:hypothetical protein
LGSAVRRVPRRAVRSAATGGGPPPSRRP